MDKIMDIKLEEIEKEIKNIIIFYKKDDKRKKVNYSVYNPKINAIIEELSNRLQLEKEELEEKNKPYKSWMALTKAALLLSIIYLMFIVFVMSSTPSLLSILPFLIPLGISLITMSNGNKKDIDREQHVNEMLKNIEKVDNFVKVKGINRIRVAQQQISKSIQYGTDKTISAVKNFASDVIITAKEDLKNNKGQTTISPEKLKELRRQIVEEIQERQKNKTSEVDNSLDRLDDLVDGQRPMPKRKKEKGQRPSIPYEYDDLYGPDPEYRRRK